MGNTASSFPTGIENEVRIVMIGKTGSGKSDTGNSILQKEAFVTSSSCASCTISCSRGENIYDTGNKKYNLIVVDTPGLFDTEMSNDDVSKEIVKCIGISSPGPHVVIFVVSLAAKFTKEEEATAMHFVNLFGERLMDYMVIVFSHGQNIEKDSSLEKRVADAPASLRQLVKKCGNRCVAFNNKIASKDKKKKQLKQLMEVVEKMIENNGKSFYTDEMFKEAEEELQKKMEKLKSENETMMAVDLRKTVRNEVEEEGSMLSNIGQGILTAGQGIAEAAIEATGVPRLVNGIASWLRQ